MHFSQRDNKANPSFSITNTWSPAHWVGCVEGLSLLSSSCVGTLCLSVTRLVGSQCWHSDDICLRVVSGADRFVPFRRGDGRCRHANDGCGRVGVVTVERDSFFKFSVQTGTTGTTGMKSNKASLQKIQMVNKKYVLFNVFWLLRPLKADTFVL